MKKTVKQLLIFVSLVILLMIVSSKSAFAVCAGTESTIQRGTYGTAIDAYIWQVHPDDNGSGNPMYTGIVSGGEKKTLVRFDLSFIPPTAVILDAQFSINCTFSHANGRMVNAFRITQIWAENKVTWNNFGSGWNPAIIGSFDGSQYGLRTINVTNLVQQWVNGTYPNYGLILDEEELSGVYATYTSSEGTPKSSRPKLVVCYSTAGGPTYTPTPTRTPTPTPTCNPVAPNRAQNLDPGEESFCNYIAPAAVPANLTWKPPSSWGIGCPTNNNQFNIYKFDPIVHIPIPCPSCQGLSEADLNCAVNECWSSIVEGQSYYWGVETSNGSLENTSEACFIAHQPAWFQIQDGNVSANGNISSQVPSDNYFLTKVNADSGLVTYGSGKSFSYGNGILSSESNQNWELEVDSAMPASYLYFKRNVENLLVLSGGTGQPGAGIFEYQGADPLVIDGNWQIPAGQQTVILVPNSVRIETDITVPVGSFLGIFAQQDLNIDPDVEKIQGVFFTEGIFGSGTGTTQLEVQGSVAANSFSLERDLDTGNDQPAEIFSYRPDFTLFSPRTYWTSPQVWGQLPP